MWGKAAAALVLSTGLFFDSAHEANSLIVYTDPSAYASATAGLSLGEYAFGTTRTDYLTTIVTLAPFGIATVGQSVQTTRLDLNGFSSFLADFSFAKGCEFAPGCLITAPLETTISFDQPIMGFSTRASVSFDITMNGIPLPNLPFGPFPPFGHFLGVIGPISNLDFVSHDGFTDNPVTVTFDDIVVATIDEPSTVGILAAGLMLLALFWGTPTLKSLVKRDGLALAKCTKPRVSSIRQGCVEMGPVEMESGLVGMD